MLYISYLPQTYENLIVSAQTTNTINLPGVTTIECLDSNVFAIVLDALGNNKKITFSKDLKDITPQDLIITEAPYFGKESYIQSLVSLASKTFCVIPQYAYFRFSYLNNLFCSKGYFITEENREQKYIEIIEKNDEILIKHLEEYLQLLTQLNRNEKLYQCFVNGIERMQYENDPEILQSILDEANTFFTSANRQFVVVGSEGYLSTSRGKNLEVYEVSDNSAQAELENSKE